MKTLMTLLLTTLLVTACGWHLRGTQNVSLDMANVYLNAEDPHGSLATTLKRTLVSSNVTLLPSSKGAEHSIYLSRDSVNRRTVSVGNDTLAAQYELTVRAEYRVYDTDGRVIIPTTSVQAVRSYDFDANAVVAAQEEERLITKELRTNIAQQMVRRIQFALANRQTSQPSY